MRVEDIRRVAVLGAGLMGHGIAQLVAMAGYEVTMRDVAQEFLDAGMEKIRWSLDKLAEKKRITREAADQALGRIRTTIDLGEAVGACDFVIEAVPEDINIKRAVFAEVDEKAPRHAILATNTSTLPISEIAEATGRPEKVVGMHFFSPAQLMPLIEITRGRETSDEAVEVTAKLGESLGKEVVMCRRDVPGFIVNRILMALFNEAAWLLYRGEAQVIEVDSAIKYKVGLPMGPFELSDFVGIDVIYKASEAISTRDPENLLLCPLYREYYEKGQLGQKSGKGFYEYEAEKWARPTIPKEAGEKIDPLTVMAPAINSAAWLIANEVTDREGVEKAVRLGLGFPKGIMELADEWGIDAVVKVLRGKEKHGEYYRPNPLLTKMID